jgi:hypothetical protein
LEAGHRVSVPTPSEEVSDLISMATGSQEATFLSEDEHEEGESSMARVSDMVPLAGRTKSITSTDVGSPRESEGRRRQGHMSNFSQERVNSSPQLVFRRHRRILCLRFPRGTNIRRCNRLSPTSQRNLIRNSSH